jgi:hypothetical protein
MARNGICSPLILVCASIIIHVSIASDVSSFFFREAARCSLNYGARDSLIKLAFPVSLFYLVFYAGALEGHNCV